MPPAGSRGAVIDTGVKDAYAENLTTVTRSNSCEERPQLTPGDGSGLESSCGPFMRSFNYRYPLTQYRLRGQKESCHVNTQPDSGDPHPHGLGKTMMPENIGHHRTSAKL